MRTHVKGKQWGVIFSYIYMCSIRSIDIQYMYIVYVSKNVYCICLLSWWLLLLLLLLPVGRRRTLRARKHYNKRTPPENMKEMDLGLNTSVYTLCV